MQTLAIAALISVVPAGAQQKVSRAELLEALGHVAATFGRTAPGLGAHEVLWQRGRVASIEILKGSASDIRKMEVGLPEQFVSHVVESSWGLGVSGPIHEMRKIIMVDAVPAEQLEQTRHALTLGLQTPDDDAKKTLLEDLESGRLQGSVADLVPLLLLFTPARQANYQFSDAGRKQTESGAMLVLRYKQVTGDQAFTEFRNRSEQRHPAKGELWFRESDLLPLRITLRAEEILSVRYVVRTEAEVRYLPTRFGLVPETVVHREFLNRDLLVENRFSYSDYTGRVARP